MQTQHDASYETQTPAPMHNGIISTKCKYGAGLISFVDFAERPAQQQKNENTGVGQSDTAKPYLFSAPKRACLRELRLAVRMCVVAV